MAYADINTIQTYNPGDILTGAALQQIRTNQEFFIDPPACSVFNSTTQSLSSATLTSLTADSEQFDNDSMHSTSTNTSRITIQTAGRYLVFGAVRLETAVVIGNLTVRVLKNGSTSYVMGLAQVTDSTGYNTILACSRTLVLAAGDYIELQSRHSAAGSALHQLDEFAATFITR